MSSEDDPKDWTPEGCVDEGPHDLQVARRLGIQRSNLDGMWTSWSPRNSNMNAEGFWPEWVDLAREILKHDARMHGRKEPARLKEIRECAPGCTNGGGCRNTSDPAEQCDGCFIADLLAMIDRGDLCSNRETCNGEIEKALVRVQELADERHAHGDQLAGDEGASS